MTRVVHLLKTIGMGGAERHLLDLAPALRRAGLEAEVVLLQETARPAPAVTAMFRQRGVPTAVLRVRSDADPLLVGALARLLRGRAPDLVHTHLVHADTHATVAARLARVRAVVGTRHSLLAEPGRLRFPIRQGIAITARMTDHVVAVSDAVAAATQHIEGVPAERITRVYNGVALPTDPTRREPGLVVAVGRLVHLKGFDTLVEAWALAGPRPGERLVIVGDGPERGRLAALVRRHGVARTTDLAGHADDVERWLGRAAVAVQPSRVEGLGLSAVEAAAFGVPVVASAVGGLREVVRDGRTGLLVPPDDPRALAAAIRTVLDDPGRARLLGEAARERVATVFSPQAMLDRTVDVYRQVLRCGST